MGIRNPFQAAGTCLLLLLIVCGTVAQERNPIAGKIVDTTGAAIQARRLSYGWRAELP